MSPSPAGVKAEGTTAGDKQQGATTATARTGGSGKRSWDENYARLLEYYDRFQHCHVPYNWPEDPALSWWLSDQRKRQRRLPEDQKCKLDALGFSWENPKKAKEQQQWDHMFTLLEQHKQQRGDCNPPQTWPPGGPKFTRWVARQREYYKQNVLSTQRRERLESIGFTWEFSSSSSSNGATARAPQNMDKNNERWQKQYQKLAAFQKQQGHTRVPQKDKSLGAWTKKQRELWSKNLLQQDRLALLNQIGFEWSLPDAQFMENYEAAKAFKEKHGHLRVPVGGAGDGSSGNNNKKLSDWMYRQRKAHSLGKLDQQRKQLLDAIAFPWEVEPRGVSSTNAPTSTSTGLPAKAMQRITAQQNTTGGEIIMPDGGPTPQQYTTLPQLIAPQLFMAPQNTPGEDNISNKDNNSIVVNVRKRFQHGWVNGQRVKKVRRNVHHVHFSDGKQEYISDEEFEVTSFAYRNFTKRASNST